MSFFMMVRKLIENRIVGNMRAVANEQLDNMDVRELCKAIMDVSLNNFCNAVNGKTNGDIVMRPSVAHPGRLVCNNGAITVRYDKQTGKFVEVEHDEARAAEAYEILRVLNYGK